MVSAFIMFMNLDTMAMSCGITNFLNDKRVEGERCRLLHNARVTYVLTPFGGCHESADEISLKHFFFRI